MTNDLINLWEIEGTMIKQCYWSFFGAFMQQTPQAVLSLNRLLNAYHFTNIIEFGTHDGGLSSLFALYALLSKLPCISDNPQEPVLFKNRYHHKLPTTFYTFDNVIRDKNMTQLLINMGTQVNVCDILSTDNVNRIGEIIKQNGRSLVLCDNGNKVKEFEYYTPFLKVGDFIMVHDWAENQEKFEQIKKRGIWFVQESSMDKLQHIIKNNNIQQIYQKNFDETVWFCGIKMYDHISNS